MANAVLLAKSLSAIPHDSWVDTTTGIHWKSLSKTSKSYPDIFISCTDLKKENIKENKLYLKKI